MNNNITELAIIRLQTELENSIGFRDYYLKHDNIKMVMLFDEQIDNIMNDIQNLGVLHVQ